MRHIALTSTLILLLTLSARIPPAHGGNPAPARCLPGTGPYHAYLPLVMGVGGGGQPPSPECATEQEPNDTHTDAQAFLFVCTDGEVSPDWDADWYRLDLCTGPFDLILTLEGPQDANLNLYLHEDPPGWPLYSAEEPGSSETITATAIATGTYYALVQSVWGQGEYTLTVKVRR